MPQPAPGQPGDPSRSVASFRRLAVATVITSLVLVTVGGVVRATDSGLACPTWPGCFAAADFMPPANLHVWIEHTHRLVAGVLLLMIAVQLSWAWARFRDRTEILWATGIAAGLALAQAALGAIVVLLRLRAELVTAHLGLAMALVGVLLFITAAAARPAAAGFSPLARTAAVVAGIAYVQALLGGHLSGRGSGLAYAERPLLGLFSLGPIGSEAEAVNVAHRLLAVVLVGGIMALLARARRSGASGWTLRLPRLAAWLVTAQIVLGIANLASQLSFLAVIPHLAVASWLWAVLVLEVLLVCRTVTRQPTELAQPAVGAAV